MRYAVPGITIAMLLLSSCATNDSQGERPEQDNGQEAEQQTEQNGAPGEAEEFDDLAFQLPEDVTEFNGAGEAADVVWVEEEWVEEHGEGPAPEEEPAPASIMVFLEESAPAVGAITAIEGQIASWDTDYETEVEEREFPGAAGGAVLRSSYVGVDDDFTSQQWDIVVEMEETPQYHIRYGAPEDEFDVEAAERLVESIQVER